MFDIDADKFMLLLPAYLVFLFSFVVHESAHAWASCRLGDGTARYYISLNPLPHIRRTPLGMVVIPLLTYFTLGWPLGFASVPVNYLWAQQHPRRYGLVSLAGPVANVLLATVFTLIYGITLVVFRKTGADISPENMIFEVFRLAIQLNMVLAIFNIIPVPPLDGSAIACLFIPKGSLLPYLKVIWNPSMALPGMLIAYFAFIGLFNTVGVPLLLLMDGIINLFVKFI